VASGPPPSSTASRAFRRFGWDGEPGEELRWVDTGNAESNRHIIAINEALGYQIMARHLGWQRDLG
jgi:hypothetical protein